MIPPADRDGAATPSQPLRLLLLAPSAQMPGGVAEYAGLILNRVSPAIRGERMAIGRRPGEEAHSPWRLFKDYCRFVARVLGRSRPDILHVNPTLDWHSLPRDALFLVLSRLRRPRVVVVTFHGWRAATEQRIRAHPVMRWLCRLALGGADMVLVLAEANRDALLSLGLAADKVATTTTMFDGALFPGAGPDQVPGGGRSRRRILFLSRFAEGKGGEALIHAFGQLHAEFPDLVLTMAGAGPLEAPWRALAAASPAAAAIEFPGYVAGPEKARLLEEALVLVLPSATEGMPVSVLEAMAAGAAVLATAVGGLPQVVRPGETGELLAAADTAGVASGLRALLQVRGRAAEMGRAGAAVAWRRFESRQVVAGLERLYLKLLAQAGD